MSHVSGPGPSKGVPSHTTLAKHLSKDLQDALKKILEIMKNTPPQDFFGHIIKPSNILEALTNTVWAKHSAESQAPNENQAANISSVAKDGIKEVAHTFSQTHKGTRYPTSH